MSTVSAGSRRSRDLIVGHTQSPAAMRRRAECQIAAGSSDFVLMIHLDDGLVVQVQLTLGEVAALQAAVACLGYAVDGDMDVIGEAYCDDEHGIRRGDLQGAERVMERVEGQARPLREQLLAGVRRR